MSATFFHIFIGAIMLVLLNSCNRGLIEEPAGSAEYFINNQTTGALSVSFIKSQELGLISVDTISSIKTGFSRLIFMDGIIGTNPQPSDSFSELNLVSENKIIDTLRIIGTDNNLWEVIDSNIDDSGFGLRKFELMVNDSDFE